MKPITKPSSSTATTSNSIQQRGRGMRGYRGPRQQATPVSPRRFPELKRHHATSTAQSTPNCQKRRCPRGARRTAQVPALWSGVGGGDDWAADEGSRSKATPSSFSSSSYGEAGARSTSRSMLSRRCAIGRSERSTRGSNAKRATESQPGPKRPTRTCCQICRKLENSNAKLLRLRTSRRTWCRRARHARSHTGSQWGVYSGEMYMSVFH